MNFDNISIPSIYSGSPVFRYPNGVYTFEPESQEVGGKRVPEKYISYYDLDEEELVDDSLILVEKNMGKKGYNRGYDKREGRYKEQRRSAFRYEKVEEPKKRSGAKETEGYTQNDRKFFGVVAWFYKARTGMVSIKAFSNEKSTWFDTEDGNGGVTMMWEVFYRDTGVKNITIASYFFGSGKAYLKELGVMVSTKAPNGGYAGFIPSKEVSDEYRREMERSGRGFRKVNGRASEEY